VKVFSNFKHREIINLGLFSLSLIPVILYFFVIYHRITLPFDLEWGEGAGINQIYRMLSEERLYSAPTVKFAPLVYTPFYYWLASVLGGIFKQVTLTARLLSVVASFGAAGIIAWLVIKETGNRFAGWLASAIYLACFAVSDGFYDLVRVDSLYVLLVLTSFLILRLGSKPAAVAAAGLCIAIGFFTKQSTLIVFLPLVAYLLGKFWKTAWPLLPSVLLGVILPFYWINARTGGWFTYYILDLPREHGYSIISAVNFWIGDLLGPLGIACGFGLFFLVIKLSGSSLINTSELERSQGDLRKKADGKKIDLSYLLFAAGAIGAAWITRASNGGGANNAMTAYAAVAILFGLGYSAVDDLVRNTAEKENIYRTVFLGLVTIQLAGLIYNPFNFIPTDEEVEANKLLIAFMEEEDDPIWIPYRSHLPRLAGKDAYIHAVNLFELTGYFKGDILPEGKGVVDQIREDICSQSYGMIILDQPIPWIEKQLESAYQVDLSLSTLGEGRKSPLLSWQGGFDAVYIPREGYDPEGCFEIVDAERTK
jgi:hypothetical protein